MSGNCVKCGVYRLSLHSDHVLPRWQGGHDGPENRQWLCANCHEDKTRAELQSAEYKAFARGRKKPRIPSYFDALNETARTVATRPPYETSLFERQRRRGPNRIGH